MFILHHSSRSNKRERTSSESSIDTSAPPSKKQKAKPVTELICDHRPPRFWDTLSRVRLSRGAIREFDRRTSKLRRRQHLSRPPGLPSRCEENLQRFQRFSRHGGPDLAHLRGFASLPCPNDDMDHSSSQSRKRSSTSSRNNLTTNAKSSPYDGDFEQKLIDNGIYPHNRATDPHNMHDIRKYIKSRRRSLSPSQFNDQSFEEFTEACRRATNEASAMADVIPIIAGDGRKKHHSVIDTLFTNMAPIIEDATTPKPDVYDGARPERIDLRVRRSLSRYIIPSKNTSRPAAPNFFLEGKSADGRADVAHRQACYDGVVGARTIHSLQNYNASELEYDGNAYSYSTTFHNGTGTLQLYSTHPTRPHSPRGRPEYHMTQINSYAMTGNPKSFRKGATAFRNLRDHAESHRNSFIEETNRAARYAPMPDSSTTESRGSRSIIYEDQSDTSADEVAAQVKRHRPSASRSQGINTSKTKKTKASARSRHTTTGEEPKRRTKPSQKVIENMFQSG